MNVHGGDQSTVGCRTHMPGATARIPRKAEPAPAPLPLRRDTPTWRWDTAPRPCAVVVVDVGFRGDIPLPSVVMPTYGFPTSFSAVRRLNCEGGRDSLPSLLAARVASSKRRCLGDGPDPGVVTRRLRSCVIASTLWRSRSTCASGLHRRRTLRFGRPRARKMDSYRRMRRHVCGCPQFTVLAK
jgi:hypothetical protein